ncbi:RluA family pseudouridine synthase [Actomonas aquatica]|uniref:Pseudouridine synthase n=1 Tax=Actomonas aquatica TaxID=2866162 RepID=A0ABZ1C9G4_9BACT|nr:RluA family pseudouridine synthase [Opitutus sp. WL0086]WRQ88010.1 RluA family pseudouridine synthase [Opitutus sp. WL0086]
MSEASKQFVVPDSIPRARVDKALAVAFPEQSRAAWQRALDAGLVSREGVVLVRKDEVRAGDVIDYAMPAVEPTELTPTDIPLETLFEDEHLLVVNKPAGMVVHPGAGTGDDTLVHALLAHCAGELSGIGGVERPGIVHRLDRDTTGAIVVAKSDAAHRGLAEQFAERHLHKEYLALASGTPRLLSGSIDRAISRHPQHRHRMTTGEGGKPARTDWFVEDKFPTYNVTLFRCHIHSGRTHQIRVHLKSIGHPLLGDRTYGWRPDDRLPIAPERVMLHAAYLKFLHPVTARSIEIKAPLPEDFSKLMDALR